MAETDVTTPETAPGELKNDASTTVTPGTDNGSAAEVERFRKEAEQARMRANQLENELKSREQKDVEARQKRLEEDQQYKELADERAKELDTLKKEREEETARAKRESEQQKILSTYPQPVIELAETTGVSLLDDSDDAKASFKAKLDTVSEKLNLKPGATIQASNPAEIVPNTDSREQLLEGMKVGFKPAAGKFISSMPAIKEMKRNAGLKVD